MKFHLTVQIPKPKVIGTGELDIDQYNAHASFFIGNGLVDEMERAHIQYVCLPGMMISGFECIGFDRRGAKKFRYQEWYLKEAGE